MAGDVGAVILGDAPLPWRSRRKECRAFAQPCTFLTDGCLVILRMVYMFGRLWSASGRLAVPCGVLPLSACDATPAASSALPWVALSLLAAVVLVLIGAALGGRLGRRAASPAPGFPPLDQAWRALSPGMTWRTDDSLRIVEVQGSPGESWALPASTWLQRRLDESLSDAQSSSEPPLTRLLSARSRVPPRRVVSSLPGASQALELRAEPLLDGSGRFNGYAGSLVACPADTGAPAHESPAATFSYTLSHDLRAPLRVVDGFARILKEDYGSSLDRVGLGHLDRVLNAAGRMNRMIDAMLAVARLHSQPLHPQPVDLTQLAERVVDELRRQDPGREVLVELQPGLGARGDPAMLGQVMDNLIGNAWKYTAGTERPRISVGCERTDDGQCVFLVRDNGAGFDMRGVDRLFGLFQRLHSSSEFPGTGVGLASVREIILRHGGRVWAESAPGQGATFRFTLRD